MSALAARRAAQAALQSASSSPTPSASRRPAAPARTKPLQPDSPNPSELEFALPSDDDEDEDDSDSASAQSSAGDEDAAHEAVLLEVRKDVDAGAGADPTDGSEAGPSKRRRAGGRARYFVAPAEEQVGARRDVPRGPTSALSDQAGKKAERIKRKRAFSPSAPMLSSEEDEDEDGGEGEGSSGDDDEDGDEGAGGAAGLDLGSTPYGTPGPERARSTVGVSTTVTSRFVPRRGHNVETLSVEVLRQAGAQGAGAGILLSLAVDEDISLAGTFLLTPLQRPISFNSTIISPSAHDEAIPVFAPISHPISAIAPASGPGSRLGSGASESSTLLPKLRLPRTFVRDADRTLVLVREHRMGIEGMRGGAVPGFTTAWGDDKGWMGLRGVHSIPGSIIAPCYPYAPPPSWAPALASLDDGGASGEEDGDGPVVLVKGPKRSGKSTIARAALNTLLRTHAAVAWLECDLGQGEFGCGGVVGLWVIQEPVYGPAFTHPRIPLRAHYLGTPTPLTCPDEYMAAIDSLLQMYRYDVRYPSSPSTTSISTPASAAARRADVVPLVINTQGWVKGLGEELLRALEALARASHVFAFDAPLYPGHGDGEAEDKPLGWTSSPTLPPVELPPTHENRPARVFALEPAPSSPLHQRYTAADHRQLSMLAYFHATLSLDRGDANVGGGGEVRWNFSTPLVAVPPYEVAIGGESSPIRAVYIIGEGAEGIEGDDLDMALNGSIVALVEDTSDLGSDSGEIGNGDNGDFDEDDTDPVAAQGPYLYVRGRTPNLETTTFLGLAIVRSVSRPAEGLNRNRNRSKGAARGMRVHLLTPLPPSVLRRANALVKNGAMELPVSGMLDWRVGPGGAIATGPGGAEGGVAGVPWGEVPFFEAPGGAGGVGTERRRWRRNIMRKGM